MARTVGISKTPVRVVELLREEVAKTSQAATARATGLTLRGVQNYLKGIGEPNAASLKKISDYFKIGVWELLGITVKAQVQAGLTIGNIPVTLELDETGGLLLEWLNKVRKEMMERPETARSLLAKQLQLLNDQIGLTDL